MNVKVDECQGGQLVWWTYVGWMDVGLLSVGWTDVLEPFVDMGCLFFEETDTFSWDLAGAFCQEEQDGTLVEVLNVDQLDFLVMQLGILAAHGGGTWWWLGATDTSREGDWVWMASLSPVEQFVWYVNNPNDRTSSSCMTMYSTHGSAQDASCQTTFKPICQKKLM